MASLDIDLDSISRDMVLVIGDEKYGNASTMSHEAVIELKNSMTDIIALISNVAISKAIGEHRNLLPINEMQRSIATQGVNDNFIVTTEHVQFALGTLGLDIMTTP
ncbi:PREDICTED: uncharacterized protein LOC109158871 [Ipomoea nil]|uniref:uncharacterized protein LOC109158871 n=1 Tax=Ipomoea nil TaxID=35883 RepID=UPI00090169E3|nr:PREDICTED: uncharacterized protein LOC109158871 [Ipomoea nil]XP_019162303.1 PREDICTED: uncharacterized protein LOC109158871 [Ipomoea nil]